MSLHAGVDVTMSHYEETGQDRASYQGLQTCGLAWNCPCCGARICEKRRGEMNTLIAFARKAGYSIRMLTLTARHGADDNLADLLDSMKRSKKAWHQHRTWKDLKISGAIVGSVTATEVTHGQIHGWHPHFHVLVVLRDDLAASALSGLGDAWRASLRGKGLDGNGAAYDCANADKAGAYVAKWGAAEELTLSGQKRARGKGGRTPLQLLEATKAGNAEAGALWLEYAAAFRGRSQLQWSRGLKAMAGVDEVSDEDAACDETQDDQEADKPLLTIDNETWRDRGRWNRTDILDAAERSGAAGVFAVLAGMVTQERHIHDRPPDEPGLCELLDECESLNDYEHKRQEDASCP